MIQCFYHTISLPIGNFSIIEINGKLCALITPNKLKDFEQQLHRLIDDDILLLQQTTLTLQDAETQLNEYFTGQRQCFQLPIQLYGSEFQKSVWAQLQQIPYGETVTYGSIAKNLKQNGARAVGTAVGKNPLPIIVPCHRVLPYSGKLGNFSMEGGPAVKAVLLDLEGSSFRK